MKRIVITGINGLLGQNLVKEFIPDHEIHGIDLTPSIFAPEAGVSVIPMDLTDRPALEAYLEQVAPDILIHGAAYTNVDGAEAQPELAFRVNAEVPRSLAQICKVRDISLLHISTDYVFNGEAGPYRELDRCDPRGVYARSKHAGEQEVLKSGARAAVVRPNVLYGQGQDLKSSFVDWLLRELNQGRPVNIVDDQFNNPSYARRLATAIRVILEKEAWDLWHFGAREVISRHAFSLKIADTFGLPTSLIHAISTQALNQRAPRPLRSGLICEKINQELGVPILSIHEELDLLKEEMHAA